MSKYTLLGLLLQMVLYTMLLASDGLAQLRKSMEEIYLTIHLEEATLEETFQTITDKTDFKFAFDMGKVRLKQKVTTEVLNGSLADVLRDISRQANLKFRRVNENIFVSPKKGGEPIEADLVETEGMQSTTVTGQVTTSEDGSGLPGVNVIIKGTATGTVTDIDGRYSLNVPVEDAILVFSSVGYIQKEVEVGTQTEINIEMEPDITALEEIVVVGYGTQKKVNVVGSVASVEGQEITNLPVANVSNSLGGRLPGVVSVQRSGEPGNDNASINIRGFGDALVIVDGVVQQLNLIDPNDIESISVLKDAAAAVYGARAANGVILVTTKRGKTGAAKIDFSSNFGWQTRTEWPRMANSGEFTELINQGRINSGQPLKYTEYDVKVYKYQSGITDIVNEMTPDELSRFENEELRNYRNEDPNEAAFKEWAPIQQYNLSSSGGSERIKYFISGGFLNQLSMLKSNDTKYRRFNLRSNVDAKISDRLSVGMNLAAQYQQKEYPFAGIQEIMQLTYWGEPTKYKSYPDPTKPAGSIVDISNADLTGYRDLDYKEYNAALNFKYDLPGVKGLSLNGLVNYRIGVYHNDHFRKQYFTYNYDFVTDIYTRNPNPSGITSLYVQSRQDDWLTGQLFLDYSNTFGKHHVTGLLLYEGLSDRMRYVEAYREGFLSTALQILDAGGDANKNNGGTELESGRASYVGRLGYGFAEKYLLEATFRYDGNSMWAGDNQWGFFPAIMLGYRISEEPFMKNVSFLDNLKLRGSVGIAGDDNGGIPYQYLATYSINGRYVLDGGLANGIRNDGIANPNGTWAEYKTTNIGLDFGFLEGKIYGEADIFYRDGYRLLGFRSDALPTTFGASFPAENLNSSSNRGFELMLGHQNSVGEVNYTIQGNISYNRARWEHYEERDFTDVEPDIAARDRVSGRWQNIIWGYTADGLFQSQEEIDSWYLDQDGAGNNTLRPGDIKYLDMNGDSILNRYDELPIGNNTPLTMFGLDIRINWRGFDLSVFAQGASNFRMYANEERAPAQYEGNTYAYIANDTWTESNPNAGFPRFVAGNTLNNRQISTFYMRDASYVRLKNLQIGYSIPPSLLQRIGFSLARVYFSGVNLFTITKMKAFDPEAPIGDMRYYPQQKTYSVGLNLTF